MELGKLILLAFLLGITTMCCLYGTYKIVLRVRELAETLHGTAQSLYSLQQTYDRKGM